MLKLDIRNTRPWFAAMMLVVAACGPAIIVGSPPPGTPLPAPTTPAPAPTPTTDFPRLEREILVELNVARTNPQAYASRVSELLPYFNGTLLSKPGQIPVRTVEGAAAVREAISALNSQQPVRALALSSGLSAAARDLVVDQSHTGSTGHAGSDGSSPSSRIDRYGTWSVTTSENIAYGTFASGRDVVVNLIVDDGVSNRGHRRNIFDPTASVVGVACGSHPRFGAVCVIDQAGQFASR